VAADDLPLKAAGISGRSGGKGKRPDLNARVYCLNWPAWTRRERKGRRPGAAGITAAPSRARQRRGRRRKEGDGALLTGGAGASAEEEKEKGNGGAGRCGGGG
jgi:hypothetical protein